MVSCRFTLVSCFFSNSFRTPFIDFFVNRRLQIVKFRVFVVNVPSLVSNNRLLALPPVYSKPSLYLSDFGAGFGGWSFGSLEAP